MLGLLNKIDKKKTYFNVGFFGCNMRKIVTRHTENRYRENRVEVKYIYMYSLQ